MSAFLVRLPFGTKDKTCKRCRRVKPELFCYLLLHRNKPHPRELLATVFWPECTTVQSRKCLRQALWGTTLAAPFAEFIDLTPQGA
jgi:hypothetical protein